MKTYLGRYWLAIFLSVITVSFAFMSIHWGVHVATMIVTFAVWVYLTRNTMAVKHEGSQTIKMEDVTSAVKLSIDGIELQIKIIQSDLDQIRPLLNDAIVTLHSAFTGIHEQTTLQACNVNEMFKIIKFEGLDDIASKQDLFERHEKKINDGGTVIAENLGIALRALQFEDMATQLLSHISTEVNQINKINSKLIRDMGEIGGYVISVKNNNINAPRNGCPNLVDKEKKVAQDSMASGDIELF